MVEQIYSGNPRKIMRNKKVLESSLGVKIYRKGGLIFMEGSAEDEYLTLEIIEAINMGFTADEALSLKETGFGFQKLNIKTLTRRKDIKEVKGRLIGTRGKALKTLESLAGCYIRLHDSTIGIIGPIEDVDLAAAAIRKLVQGSPHNKVYGFLERQQALSRQQLR